MFTFPATLFSSSALASMAWSLTNLPAFPYSVYDIAVDNNPRETYFKADGTKMYVLGDSGDDINQFTLSTAYDIDTATADGVTLSVAAQETTPTGFFFRADGLRIYVVGSTNDTVYQYNMTVAWDLSTATYASLSFSVAAQEAAPQAIWFKSDGLRMYVLGNNDTVYSYTLGTAWTINTASYDSLSFSVVTQAVNPTGLFLKDDGTKMYVVSAAGTVYQYSLGTAYNVSTASYDSVSFDATDFLGMAATGLTFKSDGSIMYVTDNARTSVQRIDLGTAWNLSTATANTIKAFDVSAQDTQPAGLWLKSDGTKLFVLGQQNDEVYRYTLSTPYDVSTASYDSNASSFGGDNNKRGVFLKSDGAMIYTCGQQNDNVVQRSLTTPYDLSVSAAVGTFSVNPEGGNPTGIWFKSDGLRMYVTMGTAVFSYTLSVAWTVSTASYDSISFNPSELANIVDLFMSDDGTKLFLIDDADLLGEYSLGTAYNVSTASFVQSKDLSDYIGGSGGGGDRGLTFSSDGTKLYAVSANGVVVQLDL